MTVPRGESSRSDFFNRGDDREIVTVADLQRELQDAPREAIVTGSSGAAGSQIMVEHGSAVRFLRTNHGRIAPTPLDVDASQPTGRQVPEA